MGLSDGLGIRPDLTETDLSVSSADTAAPSPDPMTWATVPHATGDTSIAMEATNATDDLSGVEYYFENTLGGGHDSGWQDSPVYEDTGLTPDTQYSYRVKARDKSSNQNETAYSTEQSVTTAQVDTTSPFEQFSGNGDFFDLEHTRVLFTPGPAGTTYGISVSAIIDLPTDPTGGSGLNLGDDDNQNVNLSGGHTVSLYGQTFSSFYVGSNGYLTFTEGDGDFSESIGDHFDTIRVSALFDDLDPTAGGTISTLELNDRVVITWEGISEFGQANSNTFQVEMYYDGRIQLAWLNIDATDGLVGLSDGLGLRPGLTEIDLSIL